MSLQLGNSSSDRKDRIIQQQIRSDTQLFDSLPHGLISCLQDIDLIDPGRT